MANPGHKSTRSFVLYHIGAHSVKRKKWGKRSKNRFECTNPNCLAHGERQTIEKILVCPAKSTDLPQDMIIKTVKRSRASKESTHSYLA